MQEKHKKYLIHGGLFVITFLTTTLAGGFWIHGKMWPFTPYSWQDFNEGLYFSIPFLLILTVHEFGHYLTAKYHNIKTTLPFYIPLPPFPGSIGTMGALIRIKEFVKSSKQNFDIGLSGPLAGFIVALILLVYGFTHLPEKEHIFDIHPEYLPFGEHYEQYVYSIDTFVLKSDVEKLTQQDLSHFGDTIRFTNATPSENALNVSLGTNLLFLLFESLVDDKSKIPNEHEMMHYPLLFAGFLALLFTALNLLPVGQLDGGHVLYGLIGSHWHKKVATWVFLIFVFYAGIGILTPYDTAETLMWGLPLGMWIVLYIYFLYNTLKGLKLPKTTTLMYSLIIFIPQFMLPVWNPDIKGYSGWLFFAFLVGRFLGVFHPISVQEERLDLNRQILGWIALIIFIISFSPAPIIIR